MDKTTLLNTIQTEYAHFESLVAPLSETQLCTAPFEGEWSIKDIIAHIAAWEQICTRWLEEFLRGVTPQPSERLDNESNDRIYRENRDRSLAEVQELFHHAHQQFLHQVNLLAQTLSEEDLNAPHRFAWTEPWPGYSLIAVIADNSYEHYHDHAQQISRFMSIDAMFTQFPCLTTDRLLLRHIQPNDAEALFAIFSDEEAMQFYGHEPHRSLDDTRELIRQIHVRYAQRESIRWGITLQSEDRVIGSCSFHHFDEGFHRAEIGYELHRTFWGKGIMFEAMSAILTYGFTELGLHRVEAIIDIANERSKSLLRKLGFTYEGNLRQRYAFRGRFEDEHYFGLLKDEWHGSV